jgi:hypothetical protein
VIYFTIPIAALRTPQYMRASDAQRATWLSLLAYCYEQGNSGKIDTASDWPDGSWQQLGVRPEIVKADSPLWHSNGVHISVHFYSIDMQRIYEAKRRGGRLGAAKRWEKGNRKTSGKDNGSKPHGDELQMPER